MKVSIIIPNWCGLKLLEKNLPTVLATGPDEVIVIDDASPDDSIKFLEENYPEVKLVRHERNLGFATACNSGVKVAQGEIVVLFNLDVVPEKDALAKILPDFEDENVFAISFNETSDPKYSWTKGRFEKGFIVHENQKKDNRLHRSFWVSGGSGAFRKKMWEKLGGFDELFNPFYWEDIDLCYRAQKRGWKILWEPGAKVLHKHEAVIGKHFPKEYVDFIWERNQLIFIWKNLTNHFLFLKHFGGLVYRLRHPGYLKIILAAVSRLPWIIPRRIKEKREAVVSDKVILSLND